MTKGKTRLVRAVHPVEHTAEEFVKKYEKLCKETGFQLVAQPQWVQSKDQGDYRLTIIISVFQTPQTEGNNIH